MKYYSYLWKEDFNCQDCYFNCIYMFFLSKNMYIIHYLVKGLKVYMINLSFEETNQKS